MTPILRILYLWRPRTAELLAGLLLSLAALACAVALMGTSGALIAGGALAAGLLIRTLGPARVVLRYAERLVTHGATFHALADLRVTFFRGLAASAAGGLGFRQAGDILSRLVNDVETLDGLYLRILLPLAGALILVPIAALSAARVTPQAGITTALLLAASAFVMPLFAARTARRSAPALAQANAGLRIAALDATTGLREIRAFSAEPATTARLESASATLQAAQHDFARRVALANAGALLCGQTAILAILLTAGAHPAIAIAAAFLTTAAIEPMAGLPRAGVAAAQAATAATRVLAIAEAPRKDEHGSQPIPPNPSLRFAGVHFTWSPDTPPLFAGLTLEIPAGARVAILGPSGSGKSTLAALALKIATPQSGRILLGGTDLAGLAAADIHRHIAYLSQTTHLFDDTIRANLTLGARDATDRDLWDALDRAAIGDTIRALPDQLDSWLGEAGARLSGGQGRRIALARTLLAKSQMLILDEPCAGLDADTERAFLTTLFAQTSGQTVILIAHRLTGAEKLDRIWRLSSGHAVAAAA